MRKWFYRMLSIRGTDFITHWAYEEQISAHAQPAIKCEQLLHVQFMLSICRTNFYRTLSKRGTNFIACWAYAELISSHAEQARKCLKVEHLGRIEYGFQKSRVTGPWDHMVSVSAKKSKKKTSCLCTFKENPINVFPEKELPNFHIHVSVSDLYIARTGPHIFLEQIWQTDCGNI